MILLLASFFFVECLDPTPELRAELERLRGEVKEEISIIDVRTKGNSKLSSSLNMLLDAYRQGGMARVRGFATSHNMVVQDDLVQVTIVTTEEAIRDVRDAVEAVGGQYQLHYKNLLQALVPIGELEALAQRADVHIIREPRRAVAH